MGFSTPDAKPPAQRPERRVEVKPDDVQLGSEADMTGGSDLKRKGKRSLTRPAGSVAGGGAGGLQV